MYRLIVPAFLLFFNFAATAQDTTALTLEGFIESRGKTNYQLTECIASHAMIMDVDSITTEANATDSARVSGAWRYKVYINDTSFAGTVHYKFIYTIKKGNIYYRLYDFQHEQSESEYISAGVLYQWNEEKYSKIFSRREYNEILKQMLINMANNIRLIRKYCVLQ